MQAGSFEQVQLSRFLGSWNTDGTIPGNATTPVTPIRGKDSYEWLPGKHFLLHKADVMIGDQRSQTFEVIGFDEKSGRYTMQHYDNKGNSGYMTATYENETWIFLGESLRFTGGFKNEDSEFSGAWEQYDGKAWSHFMDIRLTKST